MLRFHWGNARGVVLTGLLGLIVAQGARASKPAIVVAEPNLALQGELTESSAWQDFVARNGAWDVIWNEDNATPKRAMSHGYQLATPPLDETSVIAAIRSFVGQNRDVFRIDPADLHLLYAFPSHNHWVVLFREQYQGLIVEDSQLTFWVTHSGKLGVFEERGVFPGLDLATTPTLSGADARDILLEANLPDGGPAGSIVTFDEPELLIAGVESPQVAHLAWKVGIGVDEPPHHFVGYVNAHTGRIMYSSDEIYNVDVIGHVEGLARQDNGCSSLVTKNLSDVQVQVQGGNSAYTDSNGNFTIPNSGSSPVQVIVRMSGRWASVSNRAGSDLSVTTTVTPGVSSNIRVDPGSPPEATWAQVDGFYQTTRTSNYIRSALPGTTISSFQELANVNINSTCNAYFNGSSINFYRSGGGCTNTAFASVVAHEYGHHVDARAGGITDGGLSEGIGDMVSMYETADPVIGPGFFSGSCGGIRNGTNSRQWPANECGGEVHCLGEVFMGFTWLVRQNFINSLGAAAGIPAAEHDAFTQLLANPGSMPDAVVAFWLADDNDGDLSNGVPHDAELTAAATAHSFPVPHPPTITSVTPGTIGRCPGSIVAVRGTNFVPTATQVRLNGVQVSVSNVTPNSLSFTDAGGGTAGPITIVISTPFGSTSLGNALTRTGEYGLNQLEPALIGHTFNLDVCGASNARYFLIASLRQDGSTFDGIPVPVGPGIVVVRDSIVGADAPLGSSGTTRLAIRVPNNINLALRHGWFVGYIQPPGGSGAALTNVSDVQFFPAGN